MKKIGDLEQYPGLSIIANAIFSGTRTFRLPDGQLHELKFFKGGKILGFDYRGRRYIEQNPDTSTDYARRVRNEGAQILWIIRTHRKFVDAQGRVRLVPTRDRDWVGRVDNGEVFRS